MKETTYDEFMEFLSKNLQGPKKSLSKAGPFIGPRGGKWADAAHTIPWKPTSPRDRSSSEEFKHGSHRGKFVPHLGLCLTDDEDSAEAYAGQNGTVFEIKMDLEGLKVEHVEGYNRETNEAPGDLNPEEASRKYNADVIIYDDEDEMGQPHTTWRVLTSQGLEALFDADPVEKAQKKVHKLFAVVPRGTDKALSLGRAVHAKKSIFTIDQDYVNEYRFIEADMAYTDLCKGGLPAGHVSTYKDGSKWRKQANGKWVQISDPTHGQMGLFDAPPKKEAKEEPKKEAKKEEPKPEPKAPKKEPAGDLQSKYDKLLAQFKEAVDTAHQSRNTKEANAAKKKADKLRLELKELKAEMKGEKPKVKEEPKPEPKPKAEAKPKKDKRDAVPDTKEAAEPVEKPKTKRKGGGRRKHQEVGTHVEGSRADLWELKLKSKGDLEKLTPAEQAKIAVKKKMAPWPDWEALAASGMDPAGAYYAEWIFSQIAAKAKDTQEDRSNYFEGIRLVLPSLLKCKTFDDVNEFTRELRNLIMNPARTEPFVGSMEEAQKKFPMLVKGKHIEDGRVVQYSYTYSREVGNRDIRVFKDDFTDNLPYVQMANALGPRFQKAILGSRTKAHMDARNVAREMIADKTSWETFIGEQEAKKTGKGKTGATKGRKRVWRWERVVTGKPERVGGTKIPDSANGPRLEKSFNLGNIQYGNYMTDADREHHLHMLEGALHDFTDVIGIKPGRLGEFGGGQKLSFGLGARGKGSSGWKKKAPSAHYEPGKRIVNITKFAGGGSVAHELGHYLDGMLHSISGAKSKGRMKGDFLTESVNEVSTDTSKALKELWRVMTKSTPERLEKQAAMKPEVDRMEKELNQERRTLKYKKPPRWASDERRAEYNEAVRVYNEKVNEFNDKSWTHANLGRSVFSAGAHNLDYGNKSPYWTSAPEMFARAFEAYVQDELAAKGRRNSYLVDGTDVMTPDFLGMVSPTMQPYPHEEERKQINAAFKEFFEAAHKSGDMAKAFGLQTFTFDLAKAEFLADLQKGKLPVGHISTYKDGSKWRKEASGKWVQVAAPHGQMGLFDAPAKKEEPKEEPKKEAKKKEPKEEPKAPKKKRSVVDKIVDESPPQTPPEGEPASVGVGIRAKVDKPESESVSQRNVRAALAEEKAARELQDARRNAKKEITKLWRDAGKGQEVTPQVRQAFEDAREVADAPKSTVADIEAVVKYFAHMSRSGGKVPEKPLNRPDPGPDNWGAKDSKQLLAQLNAHIKASQDSSTTIEQHKANFASYAEHEADIKASLNKLTKPKLQRIGGLWRDEKKADMIDSVYDNLMQRIYHLGDSFTFSPMTESFKEAVARHVNGYTDEDLKEFRERITRKADERKAKQAQQEAAISDPKTLDDFQTLDRAKGRAGMTEAQREAYDKLAAEESWDKRKHDREAQASTVKKVSADTGLSVHEGVHTKKGHKIWTVKMDKRVDRDEFTALRTAAKKIGGYYSRYGGGFIFPDPESAAQFAGVGEGDVDVSAQAEGKAAAKTDRKVSKLRALAEKQQAAAEESLGQERLANTARRAGMAASADAQARGNLAQAKTMLNIADAVDSGKAKYLSGVNARTHLDLMGKVVRQGVYEQIREEAKTSDVYNHFEKEQYRSPTHADIEAIKYPFPGGHSEHIESMAREVKALPSAKRRGAKAGLDAISYAVKNKGDSHMISFKHPRDRDAIKNLVGIAKRNGIMPGWYLEESIKDHDRMKAMDIHNEAELRMAAREYLGVKGAEGVEDPIKAMTRKLVGRKFSGYFPTPGHIVSDMLAAADVGEGDTVLEPSAGQGHIADQVKESGAEVTTLEHQSEMREVLEAKGHSVAGNDALNHAGTYDKVIMNPPFEQGQDMTHVQHAFENNLKPGGSLVAIMSEGPFFREDKKAQAFRAWLESQGGTSSKLPQGSFKTSDRPTGVSTRMVVLHKPTLKSMLDRPTQPRFILRAQV